MYCKVLMHNFSCVNALGVKDALVQDADCGTYF